MYNEYMIMFRFGYERYTLLFEDDFLEVLQSMSAPLPEDDTKKLLMAHEKNKEGQIDPNEFLGGKKYINKLYLMSSFEGKKKKKKGGKGGRLFLN